MLPHQEKMPLLSMVRHASQACEFYVDPVAGITAGIGPVITMMQSAPAHPWPHARITATKILGHMQNLAYTIDGDAALPCLKSAHQR